jgi:hypothetical protein
MSYMKNILDLNAGYISYVQQIDSIGWFGAGIQYQNYGSFDRTDNFSNVTGTFTSSDFALTVGYANLLDVNWFYGASMSYLFEGIETYSATALTFDVGLLYLIPEKRVSFGFSIQHVGTQLKKFIGATEQLPTDIRLGGSVQPKGTPLTVSLNFHRLSDSQANFVDHFSAFTAGVEFAAGKALRIRVGYDNQKRVDTKTNGTSGLGGFSAGFGLLIKKMKFDYAASSENQIGTLHRIGLSFAFDQ